MNTNFVSIFIPAYNAETTVEQAINSVLAQTYSNFELIIINDASTDNTADVINKYQHHPQVRVYHNPNNLGVGKNWNLGISLCQGDFIVRLDADDFYTPDYLGKVMALFQTAPQTDLVFTGANLLYKNGPAKPDVVYKNTWIKPGEEFLPELLRSCRIWSPTACVRKSCYQHLGGVIDNMAIHEDWEMWVRITANGQIGYIAEPLANIRILNANGCTSSAIINALSPGACSIWLKKLTIGTLPYRLDAYQLALLKQGMYEIVMAFAVFAMEAGYTDSVEKHLTFARSLLPANSPGSMQARLYARAAEVYFMEGGHHFKAWRFLLQSLRLGLRLQQYQYLKLWGRALLGKVLFEFIRENIVNRRQFPNTAKINGR